jgi:hypothetical protein
MKTRPKRRRNRLWVIGKDELVSVVQNSSTLYAVLRELGYDGSLSNYRVLKKRLSEESIDYTHILNYKPPVPMMIKRELSEMLIENSTANRTHLKKRLIGEGLLRNECYVCKQPPEWNGSPLCLQLDHINGVGDDNRIENLRIICPNCHSQSETFGGRNTHRKHKPKTKISKPRPRKITWPTPSELKDLLWKIPTSQISKLFGVSDKAVEKWARKYGLDKPGRGYWTKIN